VKDGFRCPISGKPIFYNEFHEKVDKEKFRPILKKRGFMKRDPRARQRRKAGFAGKSRAKKQSPKR